MKALVLSAPEGPQGLSLEEIPRPEPGRGEARVALRAASFNHRELWIARGQYPGMKLPCVLGADGAGVVDVVGDGVHSKWIGREVMIYPATGWGDHPDFPARDFSVLGMPLPGTFAEYICVPAETLAEKPPHLDFAEAACVPLAGLTAWRALTCKARLAPGEKLLITGIGGGVATWALAFAKALGAEVYVTSGSMEKIETAKQLGAVGGVSYRDEKWGKPLQQLSGGIDVVFDGAPAGSYEQYSRCLRSGARVVVYGSTGGVNFQVSAPDLFLRNLRIVGTNMGTPAEFQTMAEFVAGHGLRPVIERRFPLAEGRAALLHLQNSHSMGKVVLTIPV